MRFGLQEYSNLRVSIERVRIYQLSSEEYENETLTLEFDYEHRVQKLEDS